jgi:cob(I)alamin adenosyltransferase
MAKIYTKTGDKGDTGLVSGTRISKADPRIDLYGELDDFNSRLGMAIALIEREPKLASSVAFLHHLQSAIFDLSSNLACEPDKRSEFKLPQVPESFIHEIEKEIDRMDKDLPSLKNFILPGGTLAASTFHVARTGARNVERRLVNFSKNEELPENALVLLNRASDYLFVLARYVNKIQGGNERNWIPRK